jgi:hypothetical protein
VEPKLAGAPSEDGFEGWQLWIGEVIPGEERTATLGAEVVEDGCVVASATVTAFEVSEDSTTLLRRQSLSTETISAIG